MANAHAHVTRAAQEAHVQRQQKHQWSQEETRKFHQDYKTDRNVAQWHQDVEWKGPAAAHKRETQAVLVESRAKLDDRRRRLAEMLAAEQAAYKEELAAMATDTDGNRREVERQALAFKTQRERTLNQTAARALQRHWEINSHDLRNLNKCAINQVLAERAHQLRHKQQLSQELSQEEIYWNTVALEEARKKEARQAQDDLKQRELNRQTVQVLDAQVVELAERRRQEALLEMKEAETVRHTAELAQQRADDVDRDRAARKVRLREEQQQQTLLRARTKQTAQQTEAEADAFYQMLTTHEISVAAADSAARDRLRLEMVQTNQQLVHNREQKVLEQAMTDMAMLEAAARTNAILDEQAQAKERERRRTSADCRREQQDMIARKRETLTAQQQEQQRERQRLVADEADYLRSLSETEARRLREAQQVQDDLKKQVLEKREHRLILEEEARRDREAAAQVAEAEQRRLHAALVASHGRGVSRQHRVTQPWD